MSSPKPSWVPNASHSWEAKLGNICRGYPGKITRAMPKIQLFSFTLQCNFKYSIHIHLITGRRNVRILLEYREKRLQQSCGMTGVSSFHCSAFVALKTRCLYEIMLVGWMSGFCSLHFAEVTGLNCAEFIFSLKRAKLTKSFRNLSELRQLKTKY